MMLLCKLMSQRDYFFVIVPGLYALFGTRFTGVYEAKAVTVSIRPAVHGIHMPDGLY